jgi:hypothetical protein
LNVIAVAESREDVIRAALEVVTIERRLSDDDTAMVALTEAEDRLAIAARTLTRAVNDLPAGRQPKGWAGPVLTLAPHGPGSGGEAA